MKTEFQMYVVGYDKEWKKQTGSGWGCGYVMIPEGSKVHELFVKEQKEERERDDFAFKYYPQDMWKCGEECTYFETAEVGGVKYCVAGFDTSHLHNDSSHDFNYVLSQTMKIKAMYEEMEKQLQVVPTT